MRSVVALQTEDAIDRKRLVLSLGGAVLLASLGFVLIFLLFAWLPRLVITPSGHISHSAEALLAVIPGSSMSLPVLLGPMMTVMAGVIGALIGRRRGRTSVKMGKVTRARF